MNIDGIEIYKATEEQIKSIYQERADQEAEEGIRNFKGTPMKPEFAKVEIDRYMNLGLSRSDVALLLASWGLETNTLEGLNNYLHEWEPKPKIKANQKQGNNFDEGIIL